MTAISKKIRELPDTEIDALLPWYAAGALNMRDMRRVDTVLARDPALAKHYAAIRKEQAETLRLNEDLGSPSPRVIQKLFAAIDADSTQLSGTWPARAPSSAAAPLRAFLVGLSPRAVAWSTALAIIGSMILGGTIGALLIRYESGLQF